MPMVIILHKEYIIHTVYMFYNEHDMVDHAKCLFTTPYYVHVHVTIRFQHYIKFHIVTQLTVES